MFIRGYADTRDLRRDRGCYGNKASRGFGDTSVGVWMFPFKMCESNFGNKIGDDSRV